MTVPADVLTALGRLNTHARAYGCGKHAIYAYKTLVAAMLASDRTLTVRLVEWRGACGPCSGTGRWNDLYARGTTYPCRKCSGTGRVRLEFAETTLPDGQVWHHPIDNGGREIAEIADVYSWDSERGRYVFKVNGVQQDQVRWYPADSWSPRQPAERLPIADAVALLNTVEAWLLTGAIDGQGQSVYWLAYNARRTMGEYALDLGQVGHACWYCESPEIATRLCRCGPPFSWCAPVCATHQHIPIEQWPQASTDTLASTPALREWLSRHHHVGVEPMGVGRW